MHKKDKNQQLEPETPEVEEAAQAVDERIEELTQDLKRVQAEFVNFKRRNDEERAEVMEMVKGKVVAEMLPLLDNIERALGHVPEELADNAWAKGVVQVGRQAEDTLRRLGVEKIVSVGQPFDPSLHEAIGMEDGEGDQEIVIEELRPGYRIGNKVVQHAMVRVGHPKAEPEGTNGKDKE
jgi:molecular chaperone GrpE